MRELGFTKAFGQSDPRYGIMHIVGPETGLSQPGMGCSARATATPARTGRWA